MSIHASRRSTGVAFLAVALSIAACVPLPITHTAQVTPMVTGTLHRCDGSPIVGAPVATWGNERQLTFELGVPGQVRRLPER
jgi:hypothetical protein